MRKTPMTVVSEGLSYKVTENPGPHDPRVGFLIGDRVSKSQKQLFLTCLDMV